MNDLSTTSSSRQEACSLVLSGLESLREGLIKYHELGLTTKEIYADLKAAGWDKSLTTLKRHQTELRKEGLIPQHYNARIQSAPKSEREPVENSTPTQPIPTQTYDCIPESVQQSHTRIPISQDLPAVQPTVDAYSDGCEPTVVSMGTESERDYEECLELFQRLFKITGKYITGGWSELQWDAIGGECRTLEDGCNIHSAGLRRRTEQNVRAFAEAFSEARTQSICESSASTDG